MALIKIDTLNPSAPVCERWKGRVQMKKFKLVIVVVLFFAVGVLLGAAAIHRPITNTLLELPPAGKPWNPKDIMVIIGSLGVRTFAGHLETLPFVALETEKTLALRVPGAKHMVHYVLVWRLFGPMVTSHTRSPT